MRIRSGCQNHPTLTATHSFNSAGDLLHYCNRCALSLLSQGFKHVAQCGNYEFNGKVGGTRIILQQRAALRQILTNQLSCIQQSLLRSESSHVTVRQNIDLFFTQLADTLQIQKHLSLNKALNLQKQQQETLKIKKFKIQDAIQRIDIEGTSLLQKLSQREDKELGLNNFDEIESKQWLAIANDPIPSLPCFKVILPRVSRWSIHNKIRFQQVPNSPETEISNVVFREEAPRSKSSLKRDPSVRKSRTFNDLDAFNSPKNTLQHCLSEHYLRQQCVSQYDYSEGRDLKRGDSKRGDLKRGDQKGGQRNEGSLRKENNPLGVNHGETLRKQTKGVVLREIREPTQNDSIENSISLSISSYVPPTHFDTDTMLLS